MFKVERHRLGPRCYVLGQRVHEYQLGVAMLGATGLLFVFELVGASRPIEAWALVGGWLVAKDWRDIFPAKRDTTAWRLGIHKSQDTD